MEHPREPIEGSLAEYVAEAFRDSKRSGLERIEENFNRIADMAGSRLSSRLAGLGKALKLAGRDRRMS